jgi:hypothetical protein
LPSGEGRRREARVEPKGFFSRKNRSACARRIFLAQKRLGLSASDFSRAKTVWLVRERFFYDKNGSG